MQILAFSFTFLHLSSALVVPEALPVNVEFGDKDVPQSVLNYVLNDEAEESYRNEYMQQHVLFPKSRTRTRVKDNLESSYSLRHEDIHAL